MDGSPPIFSGSSAVVAKARVLAEGNVEIRPARASDVASIRRVVRDAYAPYIPRIGSDPAPMSADYERLVARGAVTVAVEGDAVLAVLVLVPEPESLLLENVAVAPAAQGRGIGRALVLFAERRARELGLAKVTLYTNARMTENLSFYPALGYVEVDRRCEHGFERVFFEKTLPLP
jgi:ribosomal protein S18 acetylase RimI-like enzyme